MPLVTTLLLAAQAATLPPRIRIPVIAQPPANVAVVIPPPPFTRDMPAPGPPEPEPVITVERTLDILKERSLVVPPEALKGTVALSPMSPTVGTTSLGFYASDVVPVTNFAWIHKGGAMAIRWANDPKARYVIQCATNFVPGGVPLDVRFLSRPAMIETIVPVPYTGKLKESAAFVTAPGTNDVTISAANGFWTNGCTITQLVI